MIKLHYPAPRAEPNRVLLIMLPGAGITAGEFAEHGMTAAAQAQPIAPDIIAVEPSLELYLDGAIASQIYHEVIAPAQALGYARIWLLGISLGAMGALQTAAAYPGMIEGLVLLAPFLGTKGTIAELEHAGGLAGWSADSSAATASEQTMLRWLQARISRPGPALYLGYGEADRFAAGHRMLAKHLPADHVAVTAGGHDWQSWAVLWRALLETSPFTAKLDDTTPARIP
jgi:pimeloyl-ACP methyl ester carboxylesterase